jgi:hypothetical protein
LPEALKPEKGRAMDKKYPFAEGHIPVRYELG